MTDKMLALPVTLVLSRVRWVKARLVAEIPYRTWTGMRSYDTSFIFGLRSDKAATQVRREVPRNGYVTI